MTATRTQFVNVLGELMELSLESPLHSTLFNEVWKLESMDADLKRAFERVKDQAERALQQLEVGNHLSALGEFQSSPINADRMTAEREMQINLIKKLAWLVKKSS